MCIYEECFEPGAPECSGCERICTEYAVMEITRATAMLLQYRKYEAVSEAINILTDCMPIIVDDLNKEAT